MLAASYSQVRVNHTKRLLSHLRERKNKSVHLNADLQSSDTINPVKSFAFYLLCEFQRPASSQRVRSGVQQQW